MRCILTVIGVGLKTWLTCEWSKDLRNGDDQGDDQ